MEGRDTRPSKAGIDKRTHAHARLSWEEGAEKRKSEVQGYRERTKQTRCIENRKKHPRIGTHRARKQTQTRPIKHTSVVEPMLRAQMLGWLGSYSSMPSTCSQVERVARKMSMSVSLTELARFSRERENTSRELRTRSEISGLTPRLRSRPVARAVQNMGLVIICCHAGCLLGWDRFRRAEEGRECGVEGLVQG